MCRLQRVEENLESAAKVHWITFFKRDPFWQMIFRELSSGKSLVKFITIWLAIAKCSLGIKGEILYELKEKPEFIKLAESIIT